MRVAHFPPLNAYGNPQAVDSERDDCEHDSDSPRAEKPCCPPIECAAVLAVDLVPLLPTVNHLHCPRIAEAERDDSYKASENRPAEPLKEAAVKVTRFFVSKFLLRIVCLNFVFKESVRLAPLPDSYWNPKLINPDCDYCEQKTYNPCAEKTSGSASEFEPPAIEHSVLRFPRVKPAHRERSADAKREQCYKLTKYAPTQKLEKSSVKITLAFDLCRSINLR